MLKFKTTGLNGGIEAVEVLRETAAFVYIARKPTLGNKSTERREGKKTEWSQYHSSWVDAHSYLVSQAESEVKVARRQLELANGKLGNVKGMKPPKGAQ